MTNEDIEIQFLLRIAQNINWSVFRIVVFPLTNIDSFETVNC